MLPTVIVFRETTPGFESNEDIVPLVSNLATHIPVNSVLPKVNAG
jgi:hypothetical protein